MATKTTLSFNANELELLNSALNLLSLHYIEKSGTWGTTKDDDYFARLAYASDKIWCRVYDAQKRLGAR